MKDNQSIDWKRHDEDYAYSTLGHYAVFERPDRKPEHRSPMQRVMRQIKELRGTRFHYHIVGDGCESLPVFMHESWFQLPAKQKEEWLLRHVDWSGVSEATREKVIASQFRSRDGEINARDEWHLHDQLRRVEATTPNWSELSSTAKLETLLRSKDVDWRPFPPEFQALALSHMVRREVRAVAEGRFEVAGVFEATTDRFPFGRYKGGGTPRDSYEQSQRKGPKQPVFSKAEARRDFRWSVEEPRWKAFVEEHGDADHAAFREQMRPLWRQFWDRAKKLNRQELSELTLDWHRRMSVSPERQHLSSPSAKPRQPWPSELAEANRRKQAGQDQAKGRDHSRDKSNGHDNGHSM